MSLNERQLRAFLAIVETGSLGRAANIVGMSQPALSRLVQAMELRLDAQLFERQSTGMVLTPYGDVLVPHARLLLFEMDQALDTLAAMRGLRRGRARIGAVATIARSILPGAVDRLLRAAPMIKVELIEAADDRLVTALMRREVDLVIAGDLPATEDVIAIAECLFDDRFAVLCAREHPLARKEVVTLRDVMAERWIMPAAGATPRILFEERVRAAGFEVPPVSVETWSPSAMVAFVRSTQMLGWLPRPLFAGEESAGLVKALSVPEMEINRRFFVYRRSRGVLAAAAARLVDELPLIGGFKQSALLFGRGAAR